MEKYLEKVIALMQKTGDRVIVLDPQRPDNMYVLMTFAEYEKLFQQNRNVRDLTEDELIDKINRDIDDWKNEQNFDFFDEYPDILTSDKNKEYYGNLGYNKIRQKDEIVTTFTDDNEDKEDKDKYFKKPKRKRWTIPNEMKKKAEEIIEEDKQYLEDIYI